MVISGLALVEEEMEAERAALYGPRYPIWRSARRSAPGTCRARWCRAGRGVGSRSRWSRTAPAQAGGRVARSRCAIDRARQVENGKRAA
jgi:hypothetical protein